MAGHSHWAGIKHKKGKADKQRSKIFSKLSKEITVAAKLGDKDPAMNPRLRSAIQAARSANMPKDNIERVIKKAETGQSSNLEEIRYEGYANGGIALIVDAVTDNRNRTVADVRHAFTKFGGNMGTDGSVAYLFNKLGIVHVETTYEEDKIMEIALEAGADDFTVLDDYYEIITSPGNLSNIIEVLKEKNIESLLAENTMRAETLVNLDQEASEKVLKIMNFMDDLDDVQEVHTNAEFPDNFTIDE